MTPEERAKDFLTARPIYQTEYALASIIRAAENDALERAAATAVDPQDEVYEFCAAAIRALKHKI